MKQLFIFIFFLSFQIHLISAQDNKMEVADSFSFIFMTDIHLQPERGAATAFSGAIEKANTLDADFVMTGGDLVYDVLRGNFERSDSLFRMYKNAVQGFKMPVYHCIGNHELFGIYKESDVDSTHPDYKYGMFERHLGKTYYSFDHKGWHFIVLNSIEEKDQRYIGLINAPQMEWLKEDLAEVDHATPIVITTHIPLISTQRQVYPKNLITEVPNELWVYNRKEVLDLFKEHNLKLVLQGHLHWVEDINVQNRTRFITGGAIAGRPSWRRIDDRGDGIRYDEEGFMILHIKGEDIEWNYIDINWESKKD